MHTEQFRCMDVARWPQEPRVEFERLTLDDDTCRNPFEEDEGMTEERASLWRADCWRYVGVAARATIYVPIGERPSRSTPCNRLACGASRATAAKST